MDPCFYFNSNEHSINRNSSAISNYSLDNKRISNDVEQDICFPLKRTSTTTAAEHKQESSIASGKQTLRQSNDRNIIDLNQLDLFQRNSNSQPPTSFSTVNSHTQHKEQQQSLLQAQLVEHQKHPTLNATLGNATGNYNSIQLNDTDRFRYYHLDTGCLSSPSFIELGAKSLQLQDLLVKDNYWIDITSPSLEEMKLLSRIFNIHPLTTEDIMSREIREKCDVFQHYIFVCYRAFIYHNQQNQQILQPVTFYNIITRKFILTFHFGDLPHIHQVQQRIRQLEDYIEVIPDWINYAVIDEITDSFAPLLQQIESEVDAIDDLVLLYKTDQSDMILRIGSCRKKVIQMVRLLGTKIEVVRGLIKRISEDKASGILSNTSAIAAAAASATDVTDQQQFPVIVGETITFTTQKQTPSEEQINATGNEKKIYPDVVLYFGDVQDHILTMLQNLNHYETVLSRSESNYLARISIELTQTSNSTNHVIGRLTIFATVLLPMNLVTGLWGMNVKVPGKDYDNLIYFFWIVFSLVIFAILSLTVAKKIKLI